MEKPCYKWDHLWYLSSQEWKIKFSGNLLNIRIPTESQKMSCYFLFKFKVQNSQNLFYKCPSQISLAQDDSRILSCRPDLEECGGGEGLGWCVDVVGSDADHGKYCSLAEQVITKMIPATGRHWALPIMMDWDHYTLIMVRNNRS